MTETNKFTRRDFIKRTAVAGAGVALLTKFAVPSARALNNSPALQKWMATNPLRGLNYPAGHILGALGYPNDPNGIPVAGGIADPKFGATTTMYQIGVQEFSDKLHPSLGPTKLWGYVDLTRPIPRHLGGIIVTTRNQAARLRFTNNLPARHILPVDITIPGSTVEQNRIATHLHGGLVPWISDGGPFDWFTSNCSGDYANGLSFLNGPGGVLDNIPTMPMQFGQADYYYPNNQSTRLLWYHDHAWGITRLNAYAGIASGYLCVDPVDVTPGGAGTRLTANVPAWADMIPLVWQEKKFVSGSPGDPAAVPAILPTGTFLTDPTWVDVTRPDVQTPGSLWYEHTYNPKVWKLKTAGMLPPPDPSVIAEFFGDTMLCNGTVYPLATVQPKRYRFMFLNATNARFLNINTFVADATPDGITLNPLTAFPANVAGPTITQIGTEGGYLAKEVVHTTSAATAFNPKTLKGNLILGPAERADVVIDFSAYSGPNYPNGADIILYNDAPAPFPGGAPINDYYPGNAANPIITTPGFGPDTRQLLRIHVAPGTGQAPPVPTATGDVYLNASALLDPPALAPVPIPAGTVTPATVILPLVPTPLQPGNVAVPVRPLTLNEAFDRYGRLIQMLGTTTPQVGGGFGQPLTNAPTEVVTAGATEVWRIFNTTADTHPMHFHLVNAQVLQRQSFGMSRGLPVLNQPKTLRGPDANELGWKETIKMNPGEATDILMKFDLPTGLPFTVPPSPRTGGNEYVWHCHILEHEEHDMMRPLVVLGSPPPVPFAVSPSSVSISRANGGTALFEVVGGAFTVTSSDPNFYVVTSSTGFTVAVAGGLPAAITGAAFTVTSGANSAIVSVTLV
jgi:spore coat protein A, manganese oxidase